MSDKILITLIVATRNRPTELRDMLQSLKDVSILSRNDIEVIIVDNNPSDNSTELVCKEFSNVRYILEKIKGESFALNTGVRNAKGEYIVNTDDDVIVTDPHWLDKMYKDFQDHPNLGYVSGNVVAYNTENTVASTWEKKGGLSKGNQSKLYTQEYLKKHHRFFPWPLNKIAAGANNMVPKTVYDKIGLYSTFFGGGSPIGHANSLEFGYRVLKAGYDAMFDAEAKIYHKHPTESSDLKKKLYTYGVGNSAYQLYIFVKHGDLRSLYWGLIGHHLYVLRNIIKGFIGKYPLTFEYTKYSLLGSISGVFQFIIKYPTRDRKLHN